jgi:hypothetical protein
MAKGHACSAAFASPVPTATARHLRVHSGLIDKGQPIGFQLRLVSSQASRRPKDIGALLLVGMRRIF